MRHLVVDKETGPTYIGFSHWYRLQIPGTQLYLVIKQGQVQTDVAKTEDMKSYSKSNSIADRSVYCRINTISLRTRESTLYAASHTQFFYIKYTKQHLNLLNINKSTCRIIFVKFSKIC